MEDPRLRTGKLTGEQYAYMKQFLRLRPGPLETKCLVWTGKTKNGYGEYLRRRTHKLFWEYHNGPVPAGFELAHECNNKRCVRHVRPLTHQENRAEFSGQIKNTHCPKCCTELTPENVYTPPGRPHDRRCRICRRG
jgi:hypothetical protein